jgi:succinate dehydrogenase / fumarate reductase flavoprotein subunit
VTAPLPIHRCDVLVVGAGGAGLRAALAAAEGGAATTVVCKSLFGKAHTVMAEGGIAAALGNQWPEDNWRVHFRDTMRGGKLLNNWKMAAIHAQEAPERVLELERWGAAFDRDDRGRIRQRDFGGHRYARLVHVGDRTGLEMIRTLQNRLTSLEVTIMAETTVIGLVPDQARDAIAGAVAYRRATGEFLLLAAGATVLATGGIGRAYEITSNSWEYSGDGQAMALRAGAELIDMEFVQFHPTGMVWPASVRGTLVTEGVRGDGGVLRNRSGRRFMFDYIPEMFAAETATTEEEADRWYEDKITARRTPDLLPRDEVARAINSEVKAGRGTEHGGVFLDIASRRDAAYIKTRLPSMYHQFIKLADVDITRSPMEVGPTCHYVMGGIRVDPESGRSSRVGLYAAGEAAGGMHGANRLGGNSLGDLLVFGFRAGQAAADAARGVKVEPDLRSAEALVESAIAPLRRSDGESPYRLHRELRSTMQTLVGIVRTGPEIEQALASLTELAERSRHLFASGPAAFNPAWHLCLELESMLLVSNSIATAALARTESRGGHTRSDFPGPNETWGGINLVLATESTDPSSKMPALHMARAPRPALPQDLEDLVNAPTVSPAPKP